MDTQDFRAVVRAALEKHNKTNYWLAKWSGVPQSTISRWMRCEAQLNLASVEKIMKTLELEWADRS